MKFLIIALIALSPIFSDAQVSAEIEKAQYQVNVKGETAFYTDLHCPSSSFDRQQFESIKEMAMSKEGIFNVQTLKDGRIIRIAHLSYVEPEVMKYFGATLCDEIEVEPRQPYTF